MDKSQQKADILEGKLSGGVMKDTFAILNKSNHADVKYFRNPKEVGFYLVGRRLDNYCVVKNFIKIVELDVPEFNAIVEACQKA